MELPVLSDYIRKFGVYVKKLTSSKHHLSVEEQKKEKTNHEHQQC